LIQSLLVKELFSFDRVALEFKPGLIVFSGPSGAGKSLLMNSILSSFGIGSMEAKLSEIVVDKPVTLYSNIYDLEEEIIIKGIRKDRIRYYLNEQNISKKALYRLFSPMIYYLSVRDNRGFENEMLLTMLDSTIKKQDKSYNKLYEEYQKRYREYQKKATELEVIQEQERQLSELIEFTTFEINKIRDIAPKIGEDEELLLLKKQLSKIDKTTELLAKAEEIFLFESSVSEVLQLARKEDGYFSDTMNQLREDFEQIQSLNEELEDIDVEVLLDRLEKITALKKRYGSIEEALSYQQRKEEELVGYEMIEQDKSILESFLKLEFSELTVLAERITQARIKQAKLFEKNLKGYLSRLKLPPVTFSFNTIPLCEWGADSIDLKMEASSTGTLSGGEHNRLRLALMVVSLESNTEEHGIIVLDEIDANVSGDESIAIAELIATLSEYYQIFAISHQPHLASKAVQHILIDKTNGKSKVTVLDHISRIKEIARIIGGEIPNDEAIAFAKRLLAY